MKTAMKAFIAAAIKHFGPNHSGTTINPFQVSYMRFGKSVGGESFVYCSGGLGGTTPPYSISVWQNYITEMTNFEQAQSPTMLIFEPINRVDGTANDPNYPNYEASDAVKHGNVYGATFGFGSQGLSAADNGVSCASNWCNLFLGTFSQGSPLELQQIANSNPFDDTCGSGCNPGGESGNLRVWLPFAVSSHLNVLELYSLDADLAYDPNFCVLTGSPCDTGSYGALNGLTTTQQHDYFQGAGTNTGVGLGPSCATGTQGGANGNCEYSKKINEAQGYH